MTGLIAALAVSLALSPGQVDGDLLKWKLKEGETFYVRSTNATDQTISVGGQNQEQKTEHTSVDAYKVTKATADGYTLEITTLQSTTETNIALGGLGSFDKDMVGEKLTVTLDKDFKVKTVKGVDALLKKLTDGTPAAKALTDSVISEGTLKKAVQDLFRSGPGKPAKVGDEWKADETTPLGTSGELTAKMDFKYAGTKDGVEEVTFTGKAKLSPPKETPADAMFKTVKSDIKSDKYTGTSRFDSKVGRLKQTEELLTLKGTMTIAAGGMEVEVDVASKATSKVEVFDKSPIID
ncbi:DUF6263 family protein [Limnoglobus roseus]|uniref:Uncharacterized protein n=1 Tax=Limnoglobus roseus TaxID=2598579 RepID=A0A5C1ADA9_9BACT|nr:DUF6263 family protein [Limnoglobus roseus]QEL15752.1 hypothetical protein PX52LOC_02687 [Limnoglobus roseus]